MSDDDNPFGPEYWEERYGAPGYTWSGNPNPVLVTEASDLPPGRALDIGSGEGGDAMWLAARGWIVTGVDLAEAALEKARRHAESVDPDSAARIDWQQHDLTEWAPERGAFDLVSSQFMHLPQPHRDALFRALADAVAPGGTLLVVGHDAADAHESGHHAHLQQLMFDPGDVVRAIEGSGLTVAVAESRARMRTADGSHGHGVVHDVVVRAVRGR
jgi:SAM-dependent methyltransferase